MLCSRRATSTTSHKPMTDTELTLDQLQSISGSGKEAKTKLGKWVERTFGDGDGEHEGKDYVDEAIKVATIIVLGVHQPYGEKDPRPGVWY